MNFDEIKLYLPKFLSSKSEKELFDGLKDFPNNLDSRLYTSALKNSTNIFQGDGIKNMLIVNLPESTIKEAKSIILSNTCDIDPENLRNFPAQIVYAPIFNLKKYKETLLKDSTKTKKQIEEHIATIKEQKLTQIFYLPKIKGQIEDSIIFLDRLNSCPVKLLESKNLKDERLFTLSDYGAYLFIFKLSIHFTRIKENVDRVSGIIH